MKKYLSRKFILTMIALLGCLAFAFTSEMDGTGIAAVVGAIAALVGQYSVSNGFGRDRHD